ncbi:MAG: endonuclease [Prevotella sp.]|nr:endonuclease [Prevotella sp.]
MNKSLLYNSLATVSLLLPATGVSAQGPNNSGTYYRQADGKSGKALKTALHNIIKTHTARTYKQLYDDYKTTDVRPDGKIWDMYSATTNYTPGADENHSSFRQEGDNYNREHSLPSNWFGGASPMYTDLMHVIPTDSYVNNRRSDLPYGETNSPTWQSNEGFSKVGNATASLGYSTSKKVFEPNDEYKGDFARIYFYMATCYEDKIATWSSPMLAGNSYPAYTTWAINMLLRWAEEDPVSEKELKRNAAVYGIQHNRNPFVDYPGLEKMIWGNLQTTVFSYDNYDNPTGITELASESGNDAAQQDSPTYDMQGRHLRHIRQRGLYIRNGRKYIHTGR